MLRVRDREWRVDVLAVVLAAAVVSQVAEVVGAFAVGGPSVGGTGLEVFTRLRRVSAFEPGLYLLAVAAFSRFAPAGVCRRVAGAVCVIGALVGGASVSAQWFIQLTTDSPHLRLDALSTTISHLASLVSLAAVLYWGLEALKRSPSHEVDAAHLA
ncbi:MAG TPA: hypothetical protein VNB24_06660 [Acidimicrobiales bacterium]|nr:hypothetical protein [Acidimicrobiales bacterium]